MIYFSKCSREPPQDTLDNFVFTSQVRTDLAAIPTENTDRNYVDKWLELQLEEYERTKGTVAAMIVRKVFKLGLKTEVGSRALQSE
jgi:hypothetical protein